MKTYRYAHASALPAIAAALALSSTLAWSQEAQPDTEPEPISIDVAPVVDSAPVTTEATESAPTVVTPTADAAPAPKAKAKPAPVKAATKPATTTKVAETAVVAASTAPVAPPSTPEPIVDATPPQTAQPAPAPEAKPNTVDEDALMLGGGALALLALGGGAFALARRRRDEDEFVEETSTDPTMSAEPAPIARHDVVHEEQPAIVMPSAFAWGNSQAAEPHVEADRRPGESWVERAHRGPTPDNPSLSLRKRLKRAAFFDAREKRVASGQATAVAADAGLPENVANETRERELELA